MKRICRLYALLGCACLMTVGFAAGCSDQALDEEVTQGKKPATVQQDATKVASPRKRGVAKKASTLEDHDRYDAYLSVKKKDLDGRMFELKKGLKRATGRSKSRLKRQLRDLQRKEHDIDVAYRRYRTSKGKSKTQARADLDRTISRFDESSTVTTEEM